TAKGVGGVMTTEPNQVAGRTALPTSADRVEMAALSHAGRVRPNNEDAYIVLQVDRTMRMLDTSLPSGSLPVVATEICHGFLVADGIGGIAGGEVASRMAVTTLIQLALETPDWVLLQGQLEGRRILDRMTERFRHIDELLRAEGASKPELAGMGTTMTAA